MKRLILFLTLFAPAVALAATETQILTYPTDIEFIYDSDRDTSSGKNRVVVVDGDQGNGMVAGGDTGLLIVRGALYMHGAVGSAFFSETFAEGAGLGIQTRALTGAAPTLSTGTHNMAYLAGGGKILYTALGAGQTLNIATVATGLDISGDEADDEGYELTLGVAGASGKVFVVGSDPAFYTCATITVTDVSDTDELYVGFRRPEVVNATYDNYLDLVSIGIAASAATAAIQIETIDDNAGNVTTDTNDTWADTASKTLCVFVSGAGAATYTINGAAPTDTAAVTIDDGDPMIPFIRYLEAGAGSAAVVVNDWEVGYTALKPLGD